MKKINGFTLVELLAMLVIIGIIMIVAIPNINGMLQNQRLGVIKSDATNMVESAKAKVSRDSMITKPKRGECLVFSLNSIDTNDSIIKGPNGGSYDRFDSVVVIARDATTNKYRYYVRLVEEYKNKRIGIHLVEDNEVSSLRASDIKDVEDDIGLTKNTDNAEALSKLGVFGVIMSHCDVITKYYSGSNKCKEINGVYYDMDGNVVNPANYDIACS